MGFSMMASSVALIQPIFRSNSAGAQAGVNSGTTGSFVILYCLQTFELTKACPTLEERVETNPIRGYAAFLPSRDQEPVSIPI